MLWVHLAALDNAARFHGGDLVDLLQPFVIVEVVALDLHNILGFPCQIACRSLAGEVTSRSRHKASNAVCSVCADRGDEAVITGMELHVQRRALHSVRQDDLLRRVGVEHVQKHRILRIVLELGKENGRRP